MTSKPPCDDLEETTKTEVKNMGWIKQCEGEERPQHGVGKVPGHYSYTKANNILLRPDPYKICPQASYFNSELIAVLSC